MTNTTKSGKKSRAKSSTGEKVLGDGVGVGVGGCGVGIGEGSVTCRGIVAVRVSPPPSPASVRENSPEEADEVVDTTSCDDPPGTRDREVNATVTPNGRPEMLRLTAASKSSAPLIEIGIVMDCPFVTV